MAVQLDRETIERLRSMTPRDAYEQARDAVFRAGPSGSEDFLDVYDQLVDAGVLSWDQIEQFGG